MKKIFALTLVLSFIMIILASCGIAMPDIPAVTETEYKPLDSNGEVYTPDYSAGELKDSRYENVWANISYNLTKSEAEDTEAEATFAKQDVECGFAVKNEKDSYKFSLTFEKVTFEEKDTADKFTKICRDNYTEGMEDYEECEVYVRRIGEYEYSCVEISKDEAVHFIGVRIVDEKYIAVLTIDTEKGADAGIINKISDGINTVNHK